MYLDVIREPVSRGDSHEWVEYVMTPAVGEEGRRLTQTVSIVSVHDFPQVGRRPSQREDAAYLKDALGGRFPNARILSFYYNIFYRIRTKFFGNKV